MPARLTKQQAKQLGLEGIERTTPRKGKKTRQTVPAKDCAPNRCCTCDYTTKGETDEKRHMNEQGHHRFESVLRFTDDPA